MKRAGKVSLTNAGASETDFWLCGRAHVLTFLKKSNLIRCKKSTNNSEAWRGAAGARARDVGVILLQAGRACVSLRFYSRIFRLWLILKTKQF